MVFERVTPRKTTLKPQNWLVVRRCFFLFQGWSNTWWMLVAKVTDVFGAPAGEPENEGLRRFVSISTKVGSTKMFPKKDKNQQVLQKKVPFRPCFFRDHPGLQTMAMFNLFQWCWRETLQAITSLSFHPLVFSGNPSTLPQDLHISFFQVVLTAYRYNVYAYIHTFEIQWQ